MAPCEICFSPRTRLNETYALERTNGGCSSPSIKSTATSGADGRRRSSIVVVGGGGARRRRLRAPAPRRHLLRQVVQITHTRFYTSIVWPRRFQRCCAKEKRTTTRAPRVCECCQKNCGSFVQLWCAICVRMRVERMKNHCIVMFFLSCLLTSRASLRLVCVHVAYPTPPPLSSSSSTTLHHPNQPPRTPPLLYL